MVDHIVSVLAGIGVVVILVAVACTMAVIREGITSSRVGAWVWKKRIERDYDKWFGKLQQPAQLIYLGIEKQLDGRIPKELHRARQDWEVDFATNLEKAAFQYALRRARYRKLQHDTMVDSTTGWRPDPFANSNPFQKAASNPLTISKISQTPQGPVIQGATGALYELIDIDHTTPINQTWDAQVAQSVTDSLDKETKDDAYWRSKGVL